MALILAVNLSKKTLLLMEVNNLADSLLIFGIDKIKRQNLAVGLKLVNKLLLLRGQLLRRSDVLSRSLRLGPKFGYDQLVAADCIEVILADSDLFRVIIKN